MKKIIYSFMIILPFITVGCAAPLTDSTGKKLPIQLYSYEQDKNGSAPTVIIGHGSTGVKPGDQQMAQEIKSWGYNAVIVDHYTLRGIGSHTGRKAEGALPVDRANDFIEAAKWIRTQKWHKGKIAVVGFSQGGAGVLALAAMENTGLISSGVAFYPACLLQNTPYKPSLPIQLHMAGKDDLAYPWVCTGLRNPEYKVHYYDDATHSFDIDIPATVDKRYTHRFDPHLKKESRKHLKEFLATHLK